MASARKAALLCGVLAGLPFEPAAFASDAMNSSDKPKSGDNPDEDVAHNEFNLLPVAGGTTDIGVGGGYFAGFAHVREGYDPYLWNIESAGLITVKERNGKVVFPYQDDYVALTIPRLFGAPLRLDVRPEYSWETTLGYYGLGNNSPAPANLGSSSTYYEYGRLHPELVIDVRWRVRDHLEGLVGLGYSHSWLQIGSQSKLASDLQTGSPEVKHLLGSVSAAGVATAAGGLQWDSRDSEVSSHSGSYDTLGLKVSPGGVAALPYRYAEATAIARVFFPIVGPHVVLAARLVGDVLIGQPPFYELSRFEDTYAIGGQNGVRGVPGQRYYGKVKVIGNVEIRTEIVSFHALGNRMLFGVVGFADGGRVWADTSFHPELDGTGIGLKYGVGGGLRLQSGSSFVLRADIAWSPDAMPIGGYFSAGQMF
jgi:outer membrane protein assembly factor BamA